jgi:hypothetical protein
MNQKHTSMHTLGSILTCHSNISSAYVHVLNNDTHTVALKQAMAHEIFTQGQGDTLISIMW